MMKQFFIDKFEYNFESNQKVIEALIMLPEAYSEKIQRLFCHTLNAQNIWNHRILGKPFTQEVWQVFELKELSALNSVNHRLSVEIVKNTDLSSQVKYSNTNGETFSNMIDDILYHIINHGTYHRGQIMSMLKNNGVTPFSTDFIFHKR